MSAEAPPEWGKKYTGEKIDVYYDPSRCAHVAACLRGAPEVFDTQRRPWVLPDAAPAEHVAEVVRRCPSGALHYVLTSGEPEAPGPTQITLVKNGPILAKGDLHLNTPTGPIQETRAALCRCGASENKPFCDGTHRKIGFEAEGSARPEASDE